MLWLILAVAFAVVFAEPIVGLALLALIVGAVLLAALFGVALFQATVPESVRNTLAWLCVPLPFVWIFRAPLRLLIAKLRARRAHS